MKYILLQASTGNEWVYLLVGGIALLFLVALLGALKPLFQRFTGKKDMLRQQQELIELQRQQLEELKAQRQNKE